MASQEEKIKKLAIIGKRYLRGELQCPSCSKLMSCTKKLDAETQTHHVSSTEKKEIPAVLNGCAGDEPSDKDDSAWPVAYFEPVDANVKSMYPKDMVYPSETKEYSLEELKARDFLKKLQLKEEADKLGSNVDSLKVEDSIQKSASDRKEEDMSCVSAQSVTLRTKMAWNVVQDMWSSPCSTASEPARVQEAVSTKKAIPFPIFDENSENQPLETAPSVPVPAPIERMAPPIPKFDVYSDNSVRKDGFYSERKAPATDRLVSQFKAAALSERKEAVVKPIKEDGEQNPKAGVRKSLHFQEITHEENLPVFPVPMKSTLPDDFSEMTCCTKNFDFVLPSSTPVTKKRQQAAVDRQNEQYEVAVPEKDERTAQHLSVIAEASHERFSSSSGSQGSGGLHPITPATKGVKSILEDLENIDPFSLDLKENFLSAMKFDEEHVKSPEYTILPVKVPSMTKQIKLGTQMYSVLGEIGKGAFGRVMRARLPDGNEVSLKIEKPSCRWEFYISQQIQKRVEQSVKAGFLHFDQAFIFSDGSILVAELAEFGTLLNAASQHKLVHNQSIGPAVGMHFAMEMFTIVDYLHRAKIIHADIKPDNFVIRTLPQPSEKVPCLVLIDFGRSIDMELFPKGTKFNRAVTTEGFMCSEMKEKKPWTYHTDLFGLAGSLYVILTSEYMKDIVKKEGKWKLAKSLPRTIREIWDPIFDKLLNHGSFGRIDMTTLIDPLKEAYNKITDSSKKLSFTRLARAINK